MKDSSIILAQYSVLHFLVDGICAFAMFSNFVDDSQGQLNILTYNFCAFALQLPIGMIVDSMIQRKNRDFHKLSFIVALIGLILTLAGAFLGPIVLGVGNACFHIGGGVDTIHTDRIEKTKGRPLGIFVAPGALGLFLGKKASGKISFLRLMLPLGLVIFLIAFFLRKTEKASGNESTEQIPEAQFSWKDVIPIMCCFFVVIIRSLCGISVSFSWQSVPALAFLSTLMVVGGKMLGGILSAKYNVVTIAGLSLSVAAVGYFFSELYVFGLIALLLFNFTMPITIFQPVRRFPEYAGSFFGLLTLALYVGYVLSLLKLGQMIPGRILGAIFCILSLIIILPALTKKWGTYNG